MARFAPVVPLEVARNMKAGGFLGSYHLLLAHDVMAHVDEYVEVYGSPFANLEDPHRTIIMDNSLIELGRPMPVEEVMNAATVVGAKYFVLPDHLGDFHGTKKVVEEAYNRFLALKHLYPIMTPIVVIQGRNASEYMNLAEWAQMHKCAISVPRDAVKRVGSRARLLMDIYRKYPTALIHLLGFSDDILDDISCARMINVMGIDSAMPIRAALQGIPFTLESDISKQVGPRRNYWEHPFKDTVATQEEWEALEPFDQLTTMTREDAVEMIKINISRVSEMINNQPL